MKKLFKTILIGAGLVSALAPQVVKSKIDIVVERQVINETKPLKRHQITNVFGGIPVLTEHYGGVFGLTPKEYGQRYGNGNSRKPKTNKIHRSFKIKQKHR
ncbi:hypothetical protein [Sphingobacterium psychroaquaticum]|uniref:Uncharacterized protein n=1 Tax=Sphingobacterium psychroaquaticum TaxID=561061 RepID=A0A1X7K498_9SPHI|nr:hypothetical protein [Sphingobacterium psychroaquaticum]SMG35544.1 hypothetical protein SAMN05660862_2529 [Sphingobacterium psychroaquaticum]